MVVEHAILTVKSSETEIFEKLLPRSSVSWPRHRDV
jgi:hypothetical protein